MKKKTFSAIMAVFVFMIVAVSLFAVVFSVFDKSKVYTPEKDDGYEITKYDVFVEVDKSGNYKVEETISVDFSARSHGIYRYLPIYQTARYYNKDGKLVTKNYKNTISHFRSSSYVDSFDEDGYRFFMLGDANSYVEPGETVTYNMTYTFSSGDDRDRSMDMFYYNIIGTGWDTTIRNLTFTVVFDDAVEDDFQFYVGKFGEDQQGALSRVSYSLNDNVLAGSCEELLYGEAVTVFKSFENGYFKYEKSYGFDYILLGLILITLSLILFYFFKHKEKMPVVNIVEFKAPEGLTPTEVGYLNDGELTGDDLSALIVYWASKGYIRIVEESKDKILLVKLSSLPSSAKKHEKILFEEIFYSRMSVYVSDLTNIISNETGFECAQSTKKEMKGCFTKSKDWIANILVWLLLSIFVMVGKNMIQTYVSGVNLLLQSILLIVICVGSACFWFNDRNKFKYSKQKYKLYYFVNLIAIFVPLISFMFLIETYSDAFYIKYWFVLLPILFVLLIPKIERYTEEGKKLLGKVRGLKEYIEVAEKDKLEMLVKENPEIFFEVLPYAYVLGVSDVYMKKFEDIPIIEPDWYRTSDAFTFRNVMILNSCCDIISHSVKPIRVAKNVASNISSNGFGGHSGGGGGFSGGGFGGGGGGRW